MLEFAVRTTVIATPQYECALRRVFQILIAIVYAHAISA